MKKVRYIVFIGLIVCGLLGVNSTRAMVPADVGEISLFPLQDPYTPFEEKYLEEYKTKKWKMHTAVHNFRSFFNDQQFLFMGLKGGLEYNHNYRFGLMLLGQEEAVLLNDNDQDYDYELSEVAYLAGYGEYMLVNNYRWELGIPLSFGRGGGRLVTLDGEREPVGEPEEKRFNALQVGVYGQYNINYWLGFGLGAGQRAAFSQDVEVRDYLTSPYYTFGLKVNLGRLMKSVFAHKKVKAEKKLYFETRNKKTQNG